MTLDVRLPLAHAGEVFTDRCRVELGPVARGPVRGGRVIFVGPFRWRWFAVQASVAGELVDVTELVGTAGEDAIRAALAERGLA